MPILREYGFLAAETVTFVACHAMPRVDTDSHSIWHVTGTEDGSNGTSEARQAVLRQHQDAAVRPASGALHGAGREHLRRAEAQREAADVRHLRRRGRVALDPALGDSAR